MRSVLPIDWFWEEKEKVSPRAYRLSAVTEPALTVRSMISPRTASVDVQGME